MMKNLFFYVLFFLFLTLSHFKKKTQLLMLWKPYISFNKITKIYDYWIAFEKDLSGCASPFFSCFDSLEIQNEWKKHILMLFSFLSGFLVAFTRLCKSLCQSVSLSARQSICLSHLTFFSYLSISSEYWVVCTRSKVIGLVKNEWALRYLLNFFVSFLLSNLVKISFFFQAFMI